MKQLLKRLTDLEDRDSSNIKPYLRILVNVGQSVSNAKAEYEAKNGQLGDDPNLIIRTIV